eukprot:7029232-Pyramimonas_sp.AAC.1
MVRREALSILNSCYAFIEYSKSVVTPLWPRVSLELRRLIAILPLLSTDLCAAWHPVICASDASEFGL